MCDEEVAGIMTTRNQGDLRYVFYTRPGRYGDTLRIYRQLGFPVVGGFSHGRYLEAGKGIIEVIDGDATPTSHHTAMLRGAPDYQAPRGRPTVAPSGPFSRSAGLAPKA